MGAQARIDELLAAGSTVSFEFFPPKSDVDATVLQQTIRELEPLAPSYVSVTYGAGGSTRERTHEVVVDIAHSTSLTAMAHLTCAAHSRAELEQIVGRYRDAGVRNILALHGDPPLDAGLPPGELDYAVDLVRLVRAAGDFSIGVAAFPEPHPRSPSREADRFFMAQKLDEADFAVTQLFFEAHHYFDLLESLHALGVEKPVVPGIMPVERIAQIERMVALQGSEFPHWLRQKLEAAGDDPEAVRRVGIEEAALLCRELLDGGAPGLHFYTLNRSRTTREIAALLGLDGARAAV
jgi:methylenetetrahydrofolate reductase (NADPH)